LTQGPSNLRDGGRAAQLADSDAGRLLGRSAHLHLAFRKMDHEKFQAGARNRLNLDRRYLADAVTGIDDKFVFPEPESVRRRLDQAPIAFNREIYSGLSPLIRTIEPSKFKIHFEEHPSFEIGDPASSPITNKLPGRQLLRR
jgi:hypothetical protein